MKFNCIFIFLFYTQSINANNLYKRLCTPNLEQIDELIKRAFAIKESNSSSLQNLHSWTYEEELRNFCALNGYENDKLPEQIKISKSSSYSERKEIDDKTRPSDVVITVKVPIHKFFIDENNETSFKYWFIHKWPYEPFLCKNCRSFLSFSTANKRKNESNKLSFIYGLMQNKYSSIVNSEQFETIKRENKNEFSKQEFIFLANESFKDLESFDNGTNDNLTVNDEIKQTVYINISTFADPNKYLLVGMNMTKSDNIIFYNETNISKRRLKRDTDRTNLSYMNANEFYLEYSLCYGLNANHFLPFFNCLPLHVEDHLKESNSIPFKISDCICWNFHAFKSK